MLNPKTIVKLSNSIGLIAIILLIFFVFGFIFTETFNLKPLLFQKKEVFALLLLALLALMAGALIVNIMFNLSRIASRHEPEQEDKPEKVNRLKWLFLSGFPLIAIALFLGDYYYEAEAKKESIETATQILSKFQESNTEPYSFSKSWVEQNEKELLALSQSFGNEGEIYLIWQDSLNQDNETFILSRYYDNSDDFEVDSTFSKTDYLHILVGNEKGILEQLFGGKQKNIQQLRVGRTIESFLPFEKGGKQYVLKLSVFR